MAISTIPDPHGPQPKSPVTGSVEMWAGVECTVNRVGDRYGDQLELSGHTRRLSDLDLFADLGVRALRFPILWEKVAPLGLKDADWAWTDEALNSLQRHNIRPIAGLVHHGSGPRHTDLADPSFATGLAQYAKAVARRYPWIEDWTPVNEPLTTARFSGMYGFWYPHGQDAATFVRTFLNQCRAVALSMQAIRSVIPNARLVQTDDLGKTYSTPRLAYQARFENERRWLTWDLLCGLVDSSHPIWLYLRKAGASVDDLRWFQENPCPPDILGINHYVTSERYLDENLSAYPSCTHGGNGRQAYADVEAVRVRPEGIGGARMVLQEAWERYRRPVAVTEAHLGCSREEQMRWLLEVWESASDLRTRGVDVRAVTAWSLLGAFDWNSLLTRADHHYEPGVFDIRSGRPRPTALAGLVRDLAAGKQPDHPALAELGWWHRPIRLEYKSETSARTPYLDRSAAFRRPAPRNGKPSGPILITGTNGTLGRAFARLCELRALPFRLVSRAEMDIADAASVAAAMEAIRPWAVINTAGYVRVDDAETDEERCFRENAAGPALLATVCAQRQVPFVTFSSDLVFARKNNPANRGYIESDRVSPACVYGKSKAEAERLVLGIDPSALVVRTSAFFGPWDRHNFITIALRELAAGREFVAASDSVVSPTYVPDLVNATLDLLMDSEGGIWHLANQGEVTWFDLAREAAARAGLDGSRIIGRPTAELGLAAPRPRYSALDSERGRLLPSLSNALDRYFDEIRSAEAAEQEWAGSHAVVGVCDGEAGMTRDACPVLSDAA